MAPASDLHSRSVEIALPEWEEHVDYGPGEVTLVEASNRVWSHSVSVAVEPALARAPPAASFPHT